MMDYRPMTIEDSKQVADLYQLCFSDPWSLNAIQEMFQTSGYISLVVENEEKEIIAYVGMKTVLDEADITNVAVHPKMRQQGIASHILAGLLDQAKQQQIHSIFLEVRASNLPAITLYQHAGYVECGRRKKYYHEPEEDAIVMVWTDQE